MEGLFGHEGRKIMGAALKNAGKYLDAPKSLMGGTLKK
jgi:hypothetical protein